MTPHRIILFRGMNTGGVRAPVGEQRAMAGEMGLKNPRTLQASGNLVVESGMATEALEAAIETEMEARFGVRTAAMVRTPDQWAKLIAANPFPKEAAAHPAKVVAMVMKAGIRAGALDAVQALCRDGEAVEAIDGVLYFWFPNGQGQSEIFKRPRRSCSAWARAATGTRCSSSARWRASRAAPGDVGTRRSGSPVRPAPDPSA